MDTVGLDEGDAEHVNGELVQKIYFLKQEISKKLSYFYLLSSQSEVLRCGSTC